MSFSISMKVSCTETNWNFETSSLLGISKGIPRKWDRAGNHVEAAGWWSQLSTARKALHNSEFRGPARAELQRPAQQGLPFASRSCVI